MFKWLKQQYSDFVLMVFVWWGYKVMGYSSLTIHLDKTKEFVIGITFGEAKEKKK